MKEYKVTIPTKVEMHGQAPPVIIYTTTYLHTAKELEEFSENFSKFRVETRELARED